MSIKSKKQGWKLLEQRIEEMEATDSRLKSTIKSDDIEAVREFVKRDGKGKDYRLEINLPGGSVASVSILGLAIMMRSTKTAEYLVREAKSNQDKAYCSNEGEVGVLLNAVELAQAMAKHNGLTEAWIDEVFMKEHKLEVREWRIEDEFRGAEGS